MRSSQHALWITIVLVVGLVVAQVIQLTRVEPVDTRLQRICADVALKVKLAEAWKKTNGVEAQAGKTMLATLDGVRAICAENP